MKDVDTILMWKVIAGFFAVVAIVALGFGVAMMHLNSKVAVEILECRATLSEERRQHLTRLSDHLDTVESILSSQQIFGKQLWDIVHTGHAVENIKEYNNYKGTVTAEEERAKSQYVGVGGIYP